MNDLIQVTKMKDLGVMIDPELKFDEHIHEKINKAFQILGLIRRNFHNMNRNLLAVMIQSLLLIQ